MGANSSARLAGLAVAALLLGCAADDGTTGSDEWTATDERASALDVDLPLYHFDDTVKPYATRYRSIIKSTSEYEYYVGHGPPSWIDFNAPAPPLLAPVALVDGVEPDADRFLAFATAVGPGRPAAAAGYPRGVVGE